MYVPQSTTWSHLQYGCAIYWPMREHVLCPVLHRWSWTCSYFTPFHSYTTYLMQCLNVQKVLTVAFPCVCLFLQGEHSRKALQFLDVAGLHPGAHQEAFAASLEWEVSHRLTCHPTSPSTPLNCPNKSPDITVIHCIRIVDHFFFFSFATTIHAAISWALWVKRWSALCWRTESPARSSCASARATSEESRSPGSPTTTVRSLSNTPFPPTHLCQ